MTITRAPVNNYPASIAMCDKKNEKPAADKIKLTHFVTAIFTLVVRKRSRNQAGENSEDLKTLKEVARRIGKKMRLLLFVALLPGAPLLARPNFALTACLLAQVDPETNGGRAWPTCATGDEVFPHPDRSLSSEAWAPKNLEDELA